MRRGIFFGKIFFIFRISATFAARNSNRNQNMGVFSAYSLPIQGLKNGIHTYNYVLDGSFFEQFEEAPIQEGSIEVAVELDKRADMMVLQFDLEGWFAAICDRCNASIEMPIEGIHDLYVKYSEEKEEDDDEVIFISRDAPSFNLAKYLYEFTVLSLPMTNVYDCENDAEPPCNNEVLKYLEAKKEDNNDDQSGSSVWDALKDLK
jgi:uncharacterized protein